MDEYKKGDKVVISVPEIGRNMLGIQLIMFSAIDNGGIPVDDKHVLGKLEDFQPVEEKIKMTAQEKKEFDELKNDWTGIYEALNSIVISRYPKLYAKMFTKPLSYKEQSKALIEFVKACANPELIGIVSELGKHEIKVGIQNLYFNDDIGTFMLLIASNVLEDHFTLDEVKQAEKQLGIQGLQAKWHEAAKGG